MPRPKGSKNKKTQIAEDLQGKLFAAETEIAALTADLKAKKAERRTLLREKAKADRLAAEKKTAEEQETILRAIAESGKTVEEVLQLLK